MEQTQPNAKKNTNQANKQNSIKTRNIHTDTKPAHTKSKSHTHTQTRASNKQAAIQSRNLVNTSIRTHTDRHTDRRTHGRNARDTRRPPHTHNRGHTTKETSVEKIEHDTE
jgi:hypothetical protein